MAGLLMILCAQVGFVNYFLTRLRLVERLLFLLCALSFFIYIVVIPEYIVLIAGIALFVLITINQRRRQQLLEAGSIPIST